MFLRLYNHVIRSYRWYHLTISNNRTINSYKIFGFQFILISYGYSWDNVSHVAHQYGAVLRSLPAHPGEGTLPLQHSREMLHYLLSAASKQRDRAESVEHLLKIYDTLLKHPDSFLDEEVSTL